MTELVRRTAIAGGWRIAVHETGAGEPVYVLVHGYGVTSRYWFRTARILGESARVLLPTMPGWRGSERPGRVLDVSELADAVADWLRSEEGPPAVVVGNSFGCQVVAELAVRSPGLVAGIVLTGPTVEPAARSFPRMIGRLVRDTVREPPSLAGIIAVDYTAFGPRNVVGVGRVAIAHRLEDVLPRVGVPALVVRGSRDRLVSQAWAERCAALLPRGRLAVIDGVGHAVNHNAADRLAPLVQAFAVTL
ncbi:MAG TPA: alpha/beta hydrolase [Mycobacteriales bacterium]|nr:alpha/beta hydrolase [Mycobacteriales bacterium]